MDNKEDPNTNGIKYLVSIPDLKYKAHCGSKTMRKIISMNA
jgi:hypothetical protein